MALGGKLREHLLLRAPHVAVGAQVPVQAVVAAGRAEAARQTGAAAEVAQAPEHAQLGHQLLGAIEHRRAGQGEPQGVVGHAPGQLERRLRPGRARVLHVVGLVEHHRARMPRDQPLQVGLEDVVVEHHDLGLAGLLGPAGLGAPVEDRDAPLGQPVEALALPGELHARRADHHGRERLVRLERGQRLHGLAEPLLVRDEGAPPRERVAHAGALEGVQLAAEHEPVELGVLGVGERDRLRGPVVLVLQLVDQVAGALLELDAGVLAEELGERRAPAPGSPGTATAQPPSRLKKRPCSGTGCASGRRL